MKDRNYYRNFAWSKYQRDVFREVVQGDRNIAVQACAGSGKCLGRGTKVLMYNGFSINVEDVKNGYALMGDDGTLRRVQGVTFGVDELYKITPVKGDSWVCNSQHILTLVNSRRSAITGYGRKIGDNEVFDISLPEYLASEERFRRYWKQIRVGVDFEDPEELPLDPYFCGLWLGDGDVVKPNSSGAIVITDNNQEVIRYCDAIALRYGLETTHVPQKGNCIRVRFKFTEGYKRGKYESNYLKQVLHDFVSEDFQKQIPHEYLVASRVNRLKLLAGLLDTDGYYHSGYYEIVTKYAQLNKDILFLARSLGFAAYSSIKSVKLAGWSEPRNYYRITISGDVSLIPSLYRQVPKRKQCKDVLRTGITVEPIGKGEYFGFTLDGNGRFLLSDFTVTHNTSTLKGIVHWLPSNTKIRIFCFNKSVADKLEKEVPSRVKVGTAHGYGYAMCMKATHSFEGGLLIDNDKYWKLAHSAIQNMIREISQGTADYSFNNSDEKALRSLTKAIYSVCHIIRIALPVFKFREIAEALREYGVVIPGNLKFFAIKLAMDCIIKGNKQASEKAIFDFDDLLYIPHQWQLSPLGKVQILMVDEAQDTNAVMQSLYRKFVQDGARIIVVGDERQSIFSFAGALADAFPMLRSEFNCVQLPLPVSYRCPSSHIELARQIIPYIQAKPDAIKGVMQTIDHAFFYENVRADDLILSRMTAPLVRTCIDLVLRGVKAQIRGKDIAEGLCSTAQDVLGHHPMARFTYHLHEWLESAIENADDDLMADTMTDTAHALQSCYDSFGNQCATIHQFCDRILELFVVDSTSECVILSTIHRAKGDEAQTVWLIASDELPPERDDSNQEIQEENLVYVAITRSKEKLYFLPNRPVYDNVGGIAILEDIDWSKLPNTSETLSVPVISMQLELC
ncbi:MAG: UvrD-helicase domain-containing protein [Brasilonema angustatum HA4187-MV1]|jgi:hypothetical protein|nr:UvrD-helicase domain-containing protein [Brasilonema angustatum HA4187-MV1]